MKDIYAKIFPGYPLAEMSALIEGHAERIGLLPVAQFFVLTSAPLGDGIEFPMPARPFRYTADQALDDWRECPGSGISFIVRWFDPNSPEHMAEYQRHKEAQAIERARRGLK